MSTNRPLHVSGTKANYSDLILQGQATWEPDLWGTIRRKVESQRATAQATAADLANVDLSLRSELALDYFEMRGLDTQQRLLDNTVQQYQDYLELTQARFLGGVATDSDVALAQTQLDQTRAQAIDIGVARAQYVHAIATAHRCPGIDFFPAAGAARSAAAAGTTGRAVAIARTPSRRCRGGTARRCCQCPDWDSDRGLLPDH